MAQGGRRAIHEVEGAPLLHLQDTGKLQTSLSSRRAVTASPVLSPGDESSLGLRCPVQWHVVTPPRIPGGEEPTELSHQPPPLPSGTRPALGRLSVGHSSCVGPGPLRPTGFVCGLRWPAAGSRWGGRAASEGHKQAPTTQQPDSHSSHRPAPSGARQGALRHLRPTAPGTQRATRLSGT